MEIEFEGGGAEKDGDECLEVKELERTREEAMWDLG